MGTDGWPRNMKSTSLQAYYNEIKPNLGEKQKLIYEVIKSNPGGITNTELSLKTGRPINTITPRVNELVKLGHVEEYERRKCTITGRLAIAWSAKRTVSDLFGNVWHDE